MGEEIKEVTCGGCGKQVPVENTLFDRNVGIYCIDNPTCYTNARINLHFETYKINSEKKLYSKIVNAIKSANIIKSISDNYILLENKIDTEKPVLGLRNIGMRCR